MYKTLINVLLGLSVAALVVVSLVLVLPKLQPAGQKIDTIHQSVVQVDGVCTGFIVSEDIVITAAHCIRGDFASIHLIEFWNHRMEPAELLYLGKPGSEDDFAVLEVYTGEIESLPLTAVKPEAFDAVYHIGYNHTVHQYLTWGMWLFNLCLSDIGCNDYIAAYVIPGDSGGPVLNERDEVVGLAWGSYWPAEIQIALVAPAKNLIKILNQLGI